MLNFSKVQEQIFQSETGASGKKIIVQKLLCGGRVRKSTGTPHCFYQKFACNFFFVVVEERANAVTAGISNIKMLSPLSW